MTPRSVNPSPPTGSAKHSGTTAACRSARESQVRHLVPEFTMYDNMSAQLAADRNNELRSPFLVDLVGQERAAGRLAPDQVEPSGSTSSIVMPADKSSRRPARRRCTLRKFRRRRCPRCRRRGTCGGEGKHLGHCDNGLPRQTLTSKFSGRRWRRWL